MSTYIWQSHYEAAMLKTQADVVAIRVTEAENLILDRLEDELHGRCFLDSRERERHS